ncbi:MAG: hypothetical protein ABII13_00385 [Patescibacteria group bacterium]|nr:hypothetical protein [Patescibacteria group bacterium]
MPKKPIRPPEMPLPPSSVEETEESKIPDKEYETRLERLRSMGRAIGEDFNMGVEVGKKRGWRYIFKPVNKIEVDPEDIREKGLDYCFGVIAHEGAHRKISRTDFIPKDVWQEMGFSFLMNAVEDPRVNNWVGDKYDGAEEWLEKVYFEDLPTEERVDEKAKEQIGYTPKHIKFGLEVIRYWHTGKFSKDLPDDVKKALDKTIKYAELAYEALPEKEPTEEDIHDQAELMYRIVYSAIWPEYEKLVDKSFDEEKMRQMLKDMMETGEIEMPEEGMSGSGEEGEKKEEGEEGGEGEGAGEPLPLDQMPEDLRKELEKKLKEKLEGMSDEERKEFEEEAEEKAGAALDDLESDLNDEIKGKFTEQPESKAEEEERKEREAEVKEEEAERAKEIEGARKKIEQAMEAERSEYDKALLEVKPYIDKVAEDIMNLFIQTRFPVFRKGFPGQRVRLKGAMDWKARKEYRELFERRLPKEREDYTFLLLVDLSGSMRGQKIDETFKGAVLFAEALNRVATTLGGVKVAIYGFQDVPIAYKDFDEELDDTLRDKMSEMQREVYNGGTHNQADYNSDAFCLDQVSGILSESGSKKQFLFVLSDGSPAPDDLHRVPKYQELNPDEELQAVVNDISKAGRQKLLGVGLGPGTEHVGNFYSDKLPGVENIPNVDVKELAEVLGKKLRELLK